jgi:hypothetical protein
VKERKAKERKAKEMRVTRRKGKTGIENERKERQGRE